MQFSFAPFHRNKLTGKIVSKPLMGLITLNQALIRTPTPNLMDIIWSESMISQAFQACYSIEGVRAHSEAHQNTLQYSRGGILSRSDE